MPLFSINNYDYNYGKKKCEKVFYAIMSMVLLPLTLKRFFFFIKKKKINVDNLPSVQLWNFVHGVKVVNVDLLLY